MEYIYSKSSYIELTEVHMALKNTEVNTVWNGSWNVLL